MIAVINQSYCSLDLFFSVEWSQIDRLLKIGNLFDEQKKTKIRKRTEDRWEHKGRCFFFALGVNSTCKSNICNGNPFVNEKLLWLKSIVGVSLSILCYVLCSNMQNYSIRLSIPIPFFSFNFFFCCPFHNGFLGIYCIDYLAPAWKCFLINNAILMMEKGKKKRQSDALMECGTFQILFSFLYEGIDRQTNRNNAKFELFVHRKQVFFYTFCVM